MVSAKNKAVVNGRGADDDRALRTALEDWRSALLAFDNAEGAVYTELAAIKLNEAAKRYGCLSRRDAEAETSVSVLPQQP